jgi:two-component system, LytTR family, sensor kinase
MLYSTQKTKNKAFWALNISGWILLIFIYLILYYRERLADTKIVFGLVITYTTGFFVSLLLRFFYKKFNYQSRSILFLSLIIVLGSILFSNFWLWIDVVFSIPLHGAKSLLERFTIQYYISSVYSHLWVLTLWSTFYFGIKLWKEWTQEKERTEKANALAQAAQLQMLRYQLNPHFLFNALNSIRALIDEDKKVARRVVTELSEFLRYSLISKNYSDVPLINEIDAIKHYFAIEKIRYEDKLEVKFDVAKEAEDFPVLSFLIHPLVENAIKYGMQTSQLPLKICIRAIVENDTLKLEVVNSGKWVEKGTHLHNPERGTGTGLKNVKRRLENAFPERYRFEIKKKVDEVCIRMEISSL